MYVKLRLLHRRYIHTLRVSKYIKDKKKCMNYTNNGQIKKNNTYMLHIFQLFCGIKLIVVIMPFLNSIFWVDSQEKIAGINRTRPHTIHAVRT